MNENIALRAKAPLSIRLITLPILFCVYKALCGSKSYFLVSDINYFRTP